MISSTTFGKILNAITKRLSEDRTILNWIFAVFYLGLIVFCVYKNKEVMDTAIRSTSMIISIIFSSWVAASSYEKVSQLKLSGKTKLTDSDNSDNSDDSDDSDDSADHVQS